MNKKIVIIFTVLLIIILLGGYFVINYFKNQEQESVVEEYTPEEEITEEQNRQTIVSLYFLEKETQELAPEARLVDIKEIINDPYDKLINMLIEGPKNDKYEKIIPDNTKLNKTYTEKDMLYIDFSSEFLSYDKQDPNEKKNLINSIVKTMTQLTEINSVKILIDGQENTDFNESYTIDANE